MDVALEDELFFNDASTDGATASSNHADRAAFRRTEVILFRTSTITPAPSLKSMSSKRAWPSLYIVASYDLLPGVYRDAKEEKRRDDEGLAKGMPSASRTIGV
jgi:hypothetical protein